MNIKSVAWGFGALAVSWAVTGNAGIVSCVGIAELTGPVAPTECFQENPGGGAQDDLAWILAQSVKLDGDSGLQKADKTDEGSTIPGYVLTVTDLGITGNGLNFEDDGYTHSFAVDGPDGTFLRYMVISWKQAGLLTGALFENVTLDVTGLLFSINANAKEGVLSHGSLHIALGDRPPSEVPEPGTLALLGLGLLGLGIARRNRVR